MHAESGIACVKDTVMRKSNTSRIGLILLTFVHVKAW